MKHDARYGELLASHRARASSLVDTLVKAANSDGGLPAEKFEDPSGAWPTAQALASFQWLKLLPADHAFCLSLRDWLVVHQNSDGGWPFRLKGESFVDTTAWAIWALSYFPDDRGVLAKGVRWLLEAQNDRSGGRGGWGINPSERDRVYSTFAAILALKFGAGKSATEIADPVDLDDSVEEAMRWLRAVRNPDGGWGMHEGVASDVANTCHGLLALMLVTGAGREELNLGFDLLKRHRRPDHLWSTVTEIFELASGLDLRLSWFTSPYCLWVSSLGLRRGLSTPEDVLDAYEAAGSLIVDQRFVALGQDGKDLRTWAIADYLLGVEAAREAFQTHESAFRELLARRFESQEIRRRHQIADIAREGFPFTIASLFNTFVKSKDDAHKRLSLVLLVFEGTIRYLASVVIAIYLQVRIEDERVDRVLRDGLTRPSLGHWWAFVTAILRLDLDWGRHSQFVEDLERCLRSNRPGKATLFKRCDELVALRNRTKGHGAVDLLSPRECEDLLEGGEETIYDLIEELAFLQHYDSFFVIDSWYDEFEGTESYRIKSCKGIDVLFDERIVTTSQRLSRGVPDAKLKYFYFQDPRSDSAINLYPFLILKECESCKRETVFCFNSVNGSDLEYLSFQCGHLTREAAPDLFWKRLSRWVAKPGTVT